MSVPTVTPEKAKRILEDGEVHWKPLTPAQRGLFGLIASGKKPTRVQRG